MTASSAIRSPEYREDPELDAHVTRLRTKAEAADNCDWISPGEFGVWGSGTVAQLSNRFEAVSFPTGADSRASVTRKRKRTWTGGGNIIATVYYTGSASSATDFTIQQVGFEFAVGDGLAAKSAAVNQGESVAGTATASDLASHTFDNYFPIACDGDLFTFQLRRAGTDSNSGAFYIIGVELEFYRDHA